MSKRWGSGISVRRESLTVKQQATTSTTVVCGLAKSDISGQSGDLLSLDLRHFYGFLAGRLVAGSHWNAITVRRYNGVLRFALSSRRARWPRVGCSPFGRAVLPSNSSVALPLDNGYYIFINK